MRWEKVRLEDLCISITDGDHQSIPLAERGIPFIVIANINSINRIEFEKARYVPIDYYEKLDEKRKPSKGDVLLTVKGSFGIPVYVDTDSPFVFQRDIAIFKCNEKVNSMFLFYYMKNREFYLYADSVAIGAAQRALTLKLLKNTIVTIPSLEKQDKIVELLAPYDKLISNNQKQIKLLEEAAQRLYKEWFVDLRFPGHENTTIVDGVPEGWERPSMNDIAHYLNGYAFKPDDWSDKGKPIIKIKEMNEGITTSTPRNEGSTIPEKYNITAGDILFSWSATLTAIIWDSEDGLLNQHLFKVTPNDGICREYVLQSILKTLDEFRNLTTGSTMKHIQRSKLKEVFVNLPTRELMDKFAFLAEVYREKILRLQKQTNALAEARDRLLPKLMNGELDNMK